MSLPYRLILGLLLSLGIALLAHRRRALSASGILGAVLCGTLILAFGGWAWGLALIVFFLSSSLLSHWRRRRKRSLEALFAKGGRRDLGQALANGGLATLLALLAHLWPHPAWAALFAGALAAASADTWATEVGVFSPNPPRLITTGQAVPPGTSGGVSGLGTLAAAGGALLLGGAFYLLGGLEAILFPAALQPPWTVIPLSVLGGLSGMLVDSLLGATLQGIYRCPRCGQETERRWHCAGPTQALRGQRWMNNDLVNLWGTLVGAAVAGVGALLLASLS